MNYSYKNLMVSVCVFLISCSIFVVKAEKKYAEDVFDKWINIQYVLPDVQLSDMKHYVTDYNVKDLYARIASNVSYLQTLSKFYNLPTNDLLEEIFTYALPLEQEVKTQFEQLCDLMEYDFSGFVRFLIEGDFSKGAVNSEEDKLGMDILMDKYSVLMGTLLFQQDPFQMSKFFLAAGNKFFEFCFYDKTFSEYRDIILDKDLHSVGKFLHAIVWKYLVSLGWKWWHKDCLDSIKKRCDQGAQLVYIAGGCDIYTLIKHGIYNIKIIDPLLPSQVRYYASGWQWLAAGTGKSGKIGDQIEFVFDDKVVTMERVRDGITGRSFPTISTGQIIESLESETVWNIYDEHKNKLGQVIFDKRFCNQDDFTSGPDRVVVMSTTEMVSSIDLTEHRGWGIDVHQFDDDFEMYVKQLRKPIGANILKHLRFACERQLDLSFIMLASDPT